MAPPSARTRFLEQLAEAVHSGVLAKLVLSKHRGSDPALRQLLVRPVRIKAGPRLSFVRRFAARDATENLAPAAALAELGKLIGGDFLHAHLFTSAGGAQLECSPDGSARLRQRRAASVPAPAAHDRAKARPIAADAPWLRALGVTDERGRPRANMAPKFRQIQKFAELLSHLAAEAGLPDPARPLRVIDAGCGKGYLTFAVRALFGAGASVRGIEARGELAAEANRVAAEQGLAPGLEFVPGLIADVPLGEPDVLIALHACDTATDDALARGIAAGSRLLIVAPCCQKEVRPQLTAPPVLAEALRHGIFQEREAAFATDALRALLLEWAGYSAKVFEFISTEHTAKNLMIAAIRSRPSGDAKAAAAARRFAAFYGIRRQALAARLGFDLQS